MNNTVDTFDSSYIQWTNWEKRDFATLRDSDRAFFDLETRRSLRSYTKRSRVLEIGFGYGSFLQYSKEQGWDVTGTEANPELVELALGKGFDAVKVTDLSGFSDETFDLVVAFDVLEHIPFTSLQPFLAHVQRILKPKGCFLARFPNGDSPLGLVYQNGDPTHVTCLGGTRIAYLMAQAKLKPVYIGAEAEPLFGVGMVKMLHRLFAKPMKWGLNRFINLVFFPGRNYCLTSPNLSLAAMKP